MSSNLILQPGRDKNSAKGMGDEKSRTLSTLTDKVLAVLNCTLLDDETTKELYGFGYALYQQERFSDATETFLYLTLHSKTDSKNFMALGACHQIQSDFQKAAQLYQYSIDLGYTDPAVHFYLGECLLRLNKKSKAVTEFELAASLSRDQDEYLDLFEKASAMVELAGKFDRL
jgi:type III secretion system low calcium response chaperone LcrH/SycD